MKAAARRLNPVLVVGLVCLAVAGVTRQVLTHYPSVSESSADFVIGALYGVAIASMLLGLWRIRQPRSQA
jgi:hypothetical protein